MTKQEFIDNVTTFWDLRDFCADNDNYYLEDLIDSDALDEWIWDDIRDWDGSWEDLSSALNGISTGYDWYRRDGSLDYVYMDEMDFEAYKREILEWAEESEVFDEEDLDSYGDEYWFVDPVTGERLLAGQPIESGPSTAEIEILFEF